MSTLSEMESSADPDQTDIGEQCLYVSIQCNSAPRRVFLFQNDPKIFYPH